MRRALAPVLYLTLTLVMTNPLVLHLASAVEDKQDALLNTWIIAWVGHGLLTDPLHLFQTNIFYPYPNTLAFSETLIPQGLLALPISLATGNTVLGYNLVLLFSFWLAAYAMYLFVFDLVHHRGAALVAGTIFAFNPYNLGNLAQVQLLSFGWLPLALLYLRKSIHNSQFERGSRPLSVRNSFLLGLYFSIQSLASIYYAFLSGIAVVLLVIWSMADGWVRAQRNRLAWVPFFRRAATQLTFSAVVIAILVVPILLPYLQVQRDLGFQRKVEESEPFSASLVLYTEVSPQNALYGSLLAPRPPIIAGGYPLDNLFPGILPVILAVVGVVAARQDSKWLYIVLLAIAFLLSLGPRLFLAPTVGTSITLPYHWLYDAVSLLHALRAPVRFDALVMFALAVLAGMGVTKLTMNKEIAGLGICLLVSVEYLAVPAANIVPVPTGNAIPEYVRWLAQQPHGTILELPMIASDPTKPLLDLTTQYLTTYHWQDTPDGYSGFNPGKRGEIAYEMQFFPNERSDALIRTLGVQYLVVHSADLPDWNTRRDAVNKTAGLQLVKQFGGDYVYRVEPRAEGRQSMSARAYFPSPATPGAGIIVYLILENRDAHSVAVLPTDTLQVEAHWSDSSVQQVAAPLPLVTSTVSVVPVRLKAPSRQGAWQVELRVSSPAIGIQNLKGQIIVDDGEPAHQIVLPARVLLSSPVKPIYSPGDQIELNLTWQPLNKIDAYYSASVRVVDAKGIKITGAQDRQPVRETMLWVPGVVVPDRFDLSLPRDLAPGEYFVQLLLYQPELGMDALLLDDANTPQEITVLGKFIVK
ncbi:MAG TPA: hypothetical protein VF932_18655 [Anaerolineae bacterium]